MASLFPVQKSNVSPGPGAEKAWNQLLDTHYEALETASGEGTVASRQRHQGRGQLLGGQNRGCMLVPTSY